MQIISDVSVWAKKGGSPLPPSAVAVGLFDGVHRGHRALLSLCRREASRRGLSAVVLTFDDDPGLKPGAARITTLPERLALFRDTGMDAAVILPFSAVRDMTPEAFTERILTGALSARLAVVGYNFRFGRGAAAGAEELAALMRPVPPPRDAPGRIPRFFLPRAGGSGGG